MIAAAFLTGWLTLSPGQGSSDPGEQGSSAGEHLEIHRSERSLQEVEEDRWRGRHEARRDQVAQASTRLDRALAAYSRSHGPGRERGGARRSGVPPGWFRSAEPHEDANGASPAKRNRDR
jgi:hypothetical protein